MQTSDDFRSICIYLGAEGPDSLKKRDAPKSFETAQVTKIEPHGLLQTWTDHPHEANEKDKQMN